MKIKFQLLLLFSNIIVVIAHAQTDRFSIGDPAPPLRMQEWIKGTPVQKFEKDRVYVVEFWATWCKPCVAAMPHLSRLADEYKDKVTVLAIDVFERKSTSIKQVKTFVEDMRHRMDFHVAIEDSSFTVQDWLDASNEKVNGIPRTFVINGEGRVAWIGHPKDLDDVLTKIINNTWDIKKALSRRIFNKYLEDLDNEVAYKLRRYEGDYYKPGDMGSPDSALFVIDELVKKEPKLKYTPVMAMFTFSALLKTNPHKAYEFGKEVIVTPTYVEPAYDFIIGIIEEQAKNFNVPKEIYRLGAECYQAKIDQTPYPELVDISKQYRKMAALYLLAGDKSKAIEAEQKAVRITENK